MMPNVVDLNEVFRTLGSLQAGQRETQRQLNEVMGALRGYRADLNGKLGDHNDRLVALETDQATARAVKLRDRWLAGIVWVGVLAICGLAAWLYDHIPRPMIAAIFLLAAAGVLA
jgi:hypothetical protein